jgi:PBP1b-binding outer membrane lipoprotein LpoB
MNESSRAPPRLRIAAGLTGALLLLASCASTPPPTETLKAAEQAISNADKADAGRYAAAELNAARTKLASANDAVKEEKMIIAQRLAEQSRAEAELASARSEAAKAAAVNKEMERGNDALVEETQRQLGEPR